MITPEQIVMRRLDRQVARLTRENERLTAKMQEARTALKGLLSALSTHLPTSMRQEVEQMIGSIE